MDTEREEELQRVNVHIDTVKEAIKLADTLKALNKVPEFEDIIINGFMEKEPARIAAICTDPELQDEVNQRQLYGMIQAVGFLGDYLRNIERRGVQMEAALEKAQEVQAELRNSTEG